LSELDPASHEDFEDQEEGCPSGLQPFDLLRFGVECRTVAAGSPIRVTTIRFAAFWGGMQNGCGGKPVEVQSRRCIPPRDEEVESRDFLPCFS